MKLSCVFLSAMLMFVMHGVVQAQETGEIVIKCEPGVQIYLDEVYRGVSTSDFDGIILKVVPIGRYKLTAVLTGFQTQTTAVQVSRGQLAILTLKPFVPLIRISENETADDARQDAAVGTLLVRSQPQACTIQITQLGVNASKTGYQWQADGVPVGVFELVGEAQGRSVRYMFEIVDGGRTVLTLDFATGVVRDSVVERRAHLAASLLKDAQSAEQASNYSAAFMAATRAVELVPYDADARALYRRLNDQRRQRVVELLAASQSAGNEGDRAEVLRSLMDLLAVDAKQVDVVATNEKLRSMTNSIGMKMTHIPAGQFMMGSPANEAGHVRDEKQHNVRIAKPFLLGVAEVTQAQWVAVMGTNPSRFQGDYLPVERVSWDDAVSFCHKLSQKEGRQYRLPTEEEWEYACRAGTSTQYHSGYGIEALKLVGWCSYTGVVGAAKSTKLVGSLQPNAWGLYDMHGNVWEWCSDRYADYPDVEAPSLVRPTHGDRRVLRGGAWTSSPETNRSAARNGDEPGVRYDSLGFRVAADLAE